MTVYIYTLIRNHLFIVNILTEKRLQQLYQVNWSHTQNRKHLLTNASGHITYQRVVGRHIYRPSMCTTLCNVAYTLNLNQLNVCVFVHLFILATLCFSRRKYYM